MGAGGFAHQRPRVYSGGNNEQGSKIVTMNLVTPCCGATFTVEYGYGDGYYPDKYVDGYWCDGLGCVNEWNVKGELIE